MSGGAGLPEPPAGGAGATGSEQGADPSVPGGWAPHDTPSAAELLEAVREFLETDVLAVTEGRVRFHVRVAANVVAMVAREIVLGPEQAAAHARRLESLGVQSDSELASAIRSGTLESRSEEVRAAVEATVRDKLAVANPRYLRPPPTS
ncbi:MAG TPA: DUF6285 domain-containing protein [Acidimicrobiales bacterium]|nr:DUF6285 domain-containing protein [Acidimicrobiales bacterium]